MAFISDRITEGGGRGRERWKQIVSQAMEVWQPDFLCSGVLCSVLICELCLNVFMQLDVQRDVPVLVSHGI